jgi:hypothetical protein
MFPCVDICRPHLVLRLTVLSTWSTSNSLPSDVLLLDLSAMRNSAWLEFER